MKPFALVLSTFLFTGLTLQVYSQGEQPKLNAVQVIGSHNSYKNAIEPALYNFLEARDSAHQLNSIQYEHISITEQLNLGLRNLEVDVYADSKGGKYAHPKGLELVPSNQPYDTAGIMKAPGFKVIHIPDIDFRTSTPTFKQYLQELKAWSDATPGHLPVFITLEPKDGGTNRFGTTPEAFTPELFDELDAVIRSVLGDSKLITPDLVRGKYETLKAAVLNGNWPYLKDVRGRFFFMLDDDGKKRDLYMKDHPSLKGRIIFANAKPGTPEAAALFRNNPEDTEIPDLVNKGYIIRTRADADTKEARANDYSRFNKAKQSGAQIITTDYYKPSKLFNSPYQVKFEDGSYSRIK